jgi:hypothetical protein
MQRDVIGLVALDLVLRIIGAGVVHVALPVHILRVHTDDAATHPARFGIPAHVIADFELLRHAAIYGSARPALKSVGWVERSETHHLKGWSKNLMGFALLNPSYMLHAAKPII